MKIAIITSVSGKSSKQLAEHLKENGIEAEVFKPLDTGRYDFRHFDYVFSYGCSAETAHQKRLNTSPATKVCIDKVHAFQKLFAAGLPHPRFWTDKKQIPKDAESLVIRQDRKGRKAEDLQYWDRYPLEGIAGPIPDGDLYTEWFGPAREYRVTVFLDQVFVYFKQNVDGDHYFNIQPLKNHRKMADACLKAAKAIGIDYVSFDVLVKSKDNFVILEGNSGAALTDEVSTAIVEYFLNL